MRRVLFMLAALACGALAAAELAIPPPSTRVTDLTGTLSAQQRAALEQTLAEFEARKGAQVAVLMVASTLPETVEQYAVRVEEAWKLGRKGVDDGVLLVIAKDDRRLRIEVGYGLEGAIPDAAGKRIIEDEIVPRFKQGDFYAGIRAGTDRIMRTIEGEPLPPPRRAADPSAAPDLFDWLVPALFLVFIAGSVLRMLFGRLLSAGLIGSVCATVVWLLFGSLIAAVAAGGILFVLALVAGDSRAWSNRGGSTRGGWSSGGGGWSSGGGWSGGGGRSGGGGASGSW